MKKFTNWVIAVSLVAFCAAAGVLLYRNEQARQSEEAFDNLRAQVGILASANAEDAAPAPSAEPAETAVPGRQPRALEETDDPVLLAYRALAQQNPDMVGWLKIEGTKVDYPVMRSPQEAGKYLHLSFEETYSRSGTLFMLPVSDPSVPNENIIIYGHHMKDGSMFGTLPVYETKEGYEAQPYITFDTLWQRGTYKIIAVFRTSLGAEDEFSYYHYEWLDDEATFDRYMRGVMANRLYDTGETAAYGDELLSLSTCDYHEPNGRLVVVAKKVQDVEVTEQ